MSDTQLPITVTILDKEYRIACGPDERDALLESAHLVDEKMREVRKTGRVIGTERIAVMVALNIAHEMLDLKYNKSNDAQSISRRIQSLQEKIELALNTSNQLEL
ncbi:MAG: cell division protein ZapA [Gammaproteobacteria bacterium]|nr:cell division protein ZapA [Gammaproteobacteria bacterium]